MNKQQTIKVILVVAAGVAIAANWLAFRSPGKSADAASLRKQMGGPSGMPRGGPGGFNLAVMQTQMVDNMARDLSLNDDQKVKISTIMQGGMEKMRAVMEDDKTSFDQKRPQMEVMRSEQDKQMRAVLTADQAIKFDEMQKKMPGMGGPGGPGGPGGMMPPPGMMGGGGPGGPGGPAGGPGR